MAKPYGAFRNPTLFEQPGAILVVSGDRTTYPEFAANVATLQTTPGSRLYWQRAGGGALAEARNVLVQQALESGAAWCWFIDDDHVFPSGVLGPLLQHNRDVVVPLVMTRKPPIRPVMWQQFPVASSATDEELMQLWRWHREPPAMKEGQRGLIEIGHGGTGGMLIAARVFRALSQPWFEWRRFDGQTCGEDTWFCLKARRAGFRIWCDLDTPIGHLTTCAVWPDMTGGVGSACVGHRLVIDGNPQQIEQ